MKQLLIDTFNITPSIVEDAVNKGRMVVEGVFQRAGVKNANGRVYPRSLWEKILNNDSIKKTLAERRCLGEVDHPNDGKTLLTRASHLVLDQKLQENGDIIGRAEILDTPNGKILQELLRSGITIGISSRGSGSVKKNNLGEDVVQDDFVFDTYDWVLSPSTIGAFPKVVTEDITEENKIEENSMTGKEKFNFLEVRASKVLGTKPSKDPSLCEVVSEAASDLIVELSKVGGDTPELKELTHDLISQLTAKRKEIRESWTQGTADTGVRRETPMEAKPAEGEGWPVNPNDAGPLNGINAGKEDFMKTGGVSGAGKGPVTEEKDKEEKKNEEEEEKKVEEGENPFEKKDKEDEDEEEEDEKKESVNRVVLAAQYLVESDETKENRVARAFAAAYLLERENRISSVEAFSRTATKMQEKFQEAVENGKIVVETTNDEKYQVALGVIEELTKRHKLLSAKVYAESQLDKVGLKSNSEARKTVAEVIKTDPTKKSIDEAIAGMVNVTGFKPKKAEENKITESTELPIKNYVEGKIAKLNEETPKSFSDGPGLAKRLSDSLSFSRSK